jgi:hypothetical protein
MSELINKKLPGAPHYCGCSRGSNPRGDECQTSVSNAGGCREKRARLQSLTRNKTAPNRTSGPARGPEPTNVSGRGELRTLLMHSWRTFHAVRSVWRTSLCQHSHRSEARWRYFREDESWCGTLRGPEDYPPRRVRNRSRRRGVDGSCSPTDCQRMRPESWSIPRGGGGPPYDNPPNALPRGGGPMCRMRQAAPVNSMGLHEWLARTRDVYLRVLLSRYPDGRGFIRTERVGQVLARPPGARARGVPIFTDRRLWWLSGKQERIFEESRCAGKPCTQSGARLQRLLSGERSDGHGVLRGGGVQISGLGLSWWDVCKDAPTKPGGIHRC